MDGNRMTGSAQMGKGVEAAMKFTEEMLAEDEKCWHARDVVAELCYCGNYIRDRKNMTNRDIRFYAYIMRKAYNMLKKQEQGQESKTVLHRDDGDYCPWCSTIATRAMGVQKLHLGTSYCPYCGHAVKWCE